MLRHEIASRRSRLVSIAAALVCFGLSFVAQTAWPAAAPALTAAGCGLAAAGGGFPGLVVAVFGAGLAPLGTELRVALGVGAVAVFDRASRIGEAAEEIAQRAVLDRLTGLYNFEFFSETLENEVARVSRYGGRCSLILFDLDRFKEFNDRHGHAAGNELLERVGAEIMRLKRTSDVAARFDGEELAVLVPGSAAQAAALAERVRESVASIGVGHRGVPVGTTISAGVAEFPAHARSEESFFAAADAALYDAKRRGRDVVVTAGVPAVAVATPPRVRAAG